MEAHVRNIEAQFDLEDAGPGVPDPGGHASRLPSFRKPRTDRKALDPKWSDMRDEELYRYLLWLGREYVSRHERLERDKAAAGGALNQGSDTAARRNQYVVHALHWIGLDFVGWSQRHPGRTDLSEVVWFHWRLLKPITTRTPIQRAEGLRELPDLGPHPTIAMAQKKERQGEDGKKAAGLPADGGGRRQDDLGCWQAQVAEVYGTAWVQALLNSERTHLAATVPTLRLGACQPRRKES